MKKNNLKSNRLTYIAYLVIAVLLVVSVSFSRYVGSVMGGDNARVAGFSPEVIVLEGSIDGSSGATTATHYKYLDKINFNLFGGSVTSGQYGEKKFLLSNDDSEVTVNAQPKINIREFTTVIASENGFDYLVPIIFKITLAGRDNPSFGLGFNEDFAEHVAETDGWFSATMMEEPGLSFVDSSGYIDFLSDLVVFDANNDTDFAITIHWQWYTPWFLPIDLELTDPYSETVGGVTVLSALGIDPAVLGSTPNYYRIGGLPDFDYHAAAPDTLYYKRAQDFFNFLYPRATMLGFGVAEKAKFNDYLTALATAKSAYMAILNNSNSTTDDKLAALATYKTAVKTAQDKYHNDLGVIADNLDILFENVSKNIYDLYDTKILNNFTAYTIIHFEIDASFAQVD